MLTPGMRELSPVTRFTARIRAFNERAGARRSRRVIRLTWYNNPPQAPVPGIYAATDFTGEFANLHFVCGYVMWVMQRNGSWRLAREEEAFVGRADAPNATAEELALLRPQVGCRD